ncbi:RNA polymerase sigma factor [Marinobacter halophilus]|uniref:RNA polymerase sigma factor n=1 Tax=Marinobacter halophilus TaxID=1323740 RepID=A0A2T1KKE6_9GAMM|nr:RNA polymerase sigma factor [Marinobacter halophilus]PSF10092.1 RNA polymerase sigma factor [Marinobacter halophilus]GGC67728.1 DNA-directed RNA polymerase sigma-70 factor [Marinobacter halophilus]
MDKAVHTESEAALIDDLKRGDSLAYRKAVRDYSPAMLSVARFYLDHSSAEEIVQDCWVTVIDAIQKFEGRSGLKTWLHRIVANRCKNTLRSSNREVATDFSESLEPELANRFNSTGRWDLPPKLKFHESADTLMEKGALSDCLDKHLSALPESQRSALMLYEAHQHKSEDVCNILDISASNLRVLLHRARQRIFLMVETFQESGEC